MTVSWINEDDNVGCTWFSQSDELKSAYFNIQQLRIAINEEL